MRDIKKKGFTIVELVIVIAVIAILAAVLIPTFTGIVENANKSTAMQEARAEWVNYCADNAETFGSFDGYIKSGEYYYTITDGQVDVDSATKTVPELEGYTLTAIADAEYAEENANVTIYTMVEEAPQG